MDAQFVRAEERMDTLFTLLEERMDTRFTSAEGRLDGMHRRFDSIDKRLERLDTRMGRMVQELRVIRFIMIGVTVSLLLASGAVVLA